MKDAEDEAFDELAKRQGDWGCRFKAKQAMAADKLQEPWKCIGPPCKCNASNAKHCVYAVFTTPPAQEPAEWLTGCPTCGMDSGCDCDTGTWNPPQRERVLFPTMLRKMWSGGEVQAWLDENVNKEQNT